MDLLYTCLSLLFVGLFLIVSFARIKLTMAYFFNYFAKLYTRRMRARKKILFDGLNQLKVNRGDGKLVILEVGSGSGANFEFFPPGSEVVCLDPNRYFEPILLDNVHRYPGITVSEFHHGAAENMRDLVETESVDAVVCTLVLCSVQDMVRSLQEILRVLKPVSRPTSVSELLFKSILTARYKQEHWSGSGIRILVTCKI